MKNKSIIFSAAAVVALMFTSCEINDTIDDMAQVGHTAPTVFWDLPSSSVSAGEDVRFIAQYYTSNKDAEIDHLELWYKINEEVTTNVSCPLVSSTLKFTMATNETVLTRDDQKIVSYPHSAFLFDDFKKAYQVDTVFPTSQTLSPISWNEVKEWDAKKFERYFPADLPQTFKDSLYSLCGVNEFRSIMIKLNIMDSERFIGCTDSTFNDNSQKWDYSIKPDSMSTITNLYNNIPFTELIYDASNSVYKIEYSKIYSLVSKLLVIDNKGIIGKADEKTVELR